MAIQDTIIETLKASQAAHTRSLATISGLRTEKAALETEVARLNSLVANLRSTVAHLESEAVKIVEPTSVQSLLASLLQVIEETQQATSTPSAHVAVPLRSQGISRVEQPRSDDTPSSPMSTRPVLRQILDRDFSATSAADASQ